MRLELLLGAKSAPPPALPLETKRSKQEATKKNKRSSLPNKIQKVYRSLYAQIKKGL